MRRARPNLARCLQKARPRAAFAASLLASLLASLPGSGPLGGLVGGLREARAQRMLQPGAMQTTPRPPSEPVPVEEFYDALKDYGVFLDTDRYGVAFCPHPDIVGPDFQPYLRGRWVMTEYGWTFTSDIRISWITDHYGRWVDVNLPHCTWAWVPGGDWSPAWVDFRVSDKVIAWRPQPYAGPRVQFRRREAQGFPRIALPPVSQSSDAGYVAVRDGEFQSRRLDYVALSGVQLYTALRDTSPLVDVRGGLHSPERDQIIARLLERRGTTVAQGDKRGAAAAPGAAQGTAADQGGEPAQRRRKGQTGVPGKDTAPQGAAGSVRAGLPGPDVPAREKQPLGQPPPTPPGRTDATAGTAGNPGTFQGAKVLEWGKPKQPAQPPKTEVRDLDRTLNKPKP